MMSGFNFTERTRVVLQMAREEATRLHHEYVGTEHILLGLVREGGGVAATALARLNIDLANVRERVEKVVRPGRAPGYSGPDLPYTSRAKQVLELAMREARQLGHGYVGSEHLLLGLIAEEKGIASQVLAAAGLTLDAARSEVLTLVGSEKRPQSLSPYPPTNYETLGAQKGDAVERVEVILHYRDGRRFNASFADAHDAQGFLGWVGR